jgi:hypothetical protein
MNWWTIRVILWRDPKTSRRLCFEKHTETKKLEVYSILCQKHWEKVILLSKYSLGRNKTIFSMLRAHYTPNFVVADHYVLRRGVLQWCPPGCPPGVSSRGALQGCPPGMSSRGVLQGCPPGGLQGCPPGVSSRGILQDVLQDVHEAVLLEVPLLVLFIYFKPHSHCPDNHT